MFNNFTSGFCATKLELRQIPLVEFDEVRNALRQYAIAPAAALGWQPLSCSTG
jgi:hypothetical protein